jgi:hypothetical protein
VLGLDQVDPAKDQGARDPLAELGLRDQQRAQPLRGDQDDLDLALGVPVHQGRPRGQLPHLGQELPRPLLHDRLPDAQPVALGDRDLAAQHHEHPRAGLARLEQQSPRPRTAAPLRSGAGGRSRRGQGRERLLVPGMEQRTFGGVFHGGLARAKRIAPVARRMR